MEKVRGGQGVLPRLAALLLWAGAAGSGGCGGLGGERGGGSDVELTNTATVPYTQRKPEIRH